MRKCNGLQCHSSHKQGYLCCFDCEYNEICIDADCIERYANKICERMYFEDEIDDREGSRLNERK